MSNNGKSNTTSHSRYCNHLVSLIYNVLKLSAFRNHYQALTVCSQDPHEESMKHVNCVQKVLTDCSP